MSRPKKCRKVCCMPLVDKFVPFGNNGRSNSVVMTIDEYETIRLIDKEGFSQEECSKYMNVARTTIQNVYNSEELKTGLKNYLYELKESIENLNSELSIEEAFYYNVNKIKALPLVNQEQKLIKDEKLQEIQRTSMKAYEMAHNVIMGNNEIDKSQLSEMKETLNQSLEGVREFNKQTAQNLVSEGLLDIMFVENPKTGKTSLRIGRNIVYKNNVQ